MSSAYSVTMSRFPEGPPEAAEYASHVEWGMPQQLDPIAEPGRPRPAPHAWRVRWIVTLREQPGAQHPHRFLMCRRSLACVGIAEGERWDDFSCGDCPFRDRDYPLPTRKELRA